jgi:predicted NUDIX family phosphoesterase
MVNKELQESVLVVPRTVIDPLCPPRGFMRELGRLQPAILANCHFLERSVAEHDFKYKQVIPYVAIRHGERFLLLRRTAKQAETRLHNMYSLGVGGHINNADVSVGAANVINSGMRRELAEEIRVEEERSCALIGVINDDSTEVARVHLGFVYLLTTDSARFTVMEPDKHTAEWQLPAELARHYDQMESWSQIVYDHLIVPLAAEGATRRESRAGMPPAGP